MKLYKKFLTALSVAVMAVPVALPALSNSVYASTDNLFPQSKFYDTLDKDAINKRADYFKGRPLVQVPQTDKNGQMHYVNRFSGITPSQDVPYWIDSRIPAKQQGIIKQAISDWNDAAPGVFNFYQVDTPKDAYMMYDFDDQTNTPGGVTWHEGNDVFTSAVIQVNHKQLTTSTASLELYEHETGHALGFTDTDINWNDNSVQQTVMGKNVKNITDYDSLSLIRMYAPLALDNAMTASK
ncbi:hypothetical protein [Companilactobacillus mishanensis]|uniref:Matrixin family metalloprotease n=1 Tax=Companilactobacillus mishanensis TaxID=2486008 RepID=A0ABW9P6Q1_9LACO|nr:hypothetical protein [Companilactobacillus mishanensis]MQS44747.1 hypothetical protein [Companilactobacillus mishanensis]